MERPQYEKIAFTAETPIPELPAKKEILKEPVKADFEREMAIQDGLIQQMRSKKDQLIKQKRTVREGGLTAGGNNTKKGELTERINVAKGIRQNKRAKQDAMRDIVSEIQKLEGEKRNLLKSMHANCHTVEAVQGQIRDSERRLTTTSLNAAAEAKLCKEIETLKASIPKAKRFSEIDLKIKDLATKKNGIYAEVKKIKAQEEGLNKEMEEIRKELETTNAEKDVTKGQLDNLQKQIDDVDKELNELYAKKDEKREAYWKGRYDFKKQREEIMHIEWMQRQKDKVVNADAIKQEREEERKLAIKALPHPFQKELDCCDHLTGYLNSLKEKAGLLVNDSLAAKEAQAAIQQEVVKEKLNEKLAAGKVEVVQTKQEREASNMLQIGGKNKRKGKKAKAAVEYEEQFNLDLMIIKKFAMLNIAAPVVNDDLDDRLEKISERRQWYIENGASKLQEQIEELNRYVDEETKDLEQEYVEEEQTAGRGGRRGGRGGYQGGRGGASTRGRGRGGYGGIQAKNEFDGEEDDDYVYSAPANKPKRNK